MKASVGLWVGGLFVPVQTLAAHQEMRGRDIRVPRGHSLEVQDIAETAPITVAIAPEGNTTEAFVDPFTTPAYSGVARQPVRSVEVVIPQRISLGRPRRDFGASRRCGHRVRTMTVVSID